MMYRQIDADRPADSMGTIQTVAGSAYLQQKVLTLLQGEFRTSA
jgi:hypothetical protein